MEYLFWPKISQISRPWPNFGLHDFGSFSGAQFSNYKIWKYSICLIGLNERNLCKEFCLNPWYQLNKMLSTAVKYIKILIITIIWLERPNATTQTHVSFFSFIIRLEECGAWKVVTMGKYALTHLPFIESVICRDDSHWFMITITKKQYSIHSGHRIWGKGKNKR